MFVGTGGNGIYLSYDGGKTWTVRNNGLSDTTINRLLIDKFKPSTIIAGPYGNGIFKTDNGGESWIQVNEGLANTYIYSLATTNSEIYAGVFGGKIFKSSTKGKFNWQLLK